MSTAEFLRRQSETCLRIARGCFDLASAERMRLMASELKAQAHELERRQSVDPPVTDRPFHLFRNDSH